MTWSLLPAFVLLVQLASAAQDAQVTPRAELHARQATADPSLLGWVSANNASKFSDLRSCDFPATLSTSGSYAQCCSPNNSACLFYSSCNNGNLLAASTSVFCDQGVCNTGVIVSTTGAKSGVSYLGCWAQSLGTTAFTLVQDIGSAAIATPTAGSSGASGSSVSGNGISPITGTGTGTGTAGVASSAGASSVSLASGGPVSTGSPGSTVIVGGNSPSSTGAAAALRGAKPLTGLVGLFMGLLALL